MNEDIRWIQRFTNFQKAFGNLKNAIKLNEERELSNLEKQGLIQSFEFTFELSWKVIKDYLNFMDENVKFPRDVVKQGFKYELIDDGDLWIDMLEKRNLMSHTYDDETFQLVFNLIKNHYFRQIEIFFKLFTNKKNDFK